MVDLPGKPFWKIVGYESGRLLFERSVPIGALSDKQVRELLARLAAQHLSVAEIIGASVKKSVRGRNELLEVQVINGGNRPGLTTTGNPYFTATIESA